MSVALRHYKNKYIIKDDKILNSYQNVIVKSQINELVIPKTVFCVPIYSHK